MFPFSLMLNGWERRGGLTGFGTFSLWITKSQSSLWVHITLYPSGEQKSGGRLRSHFWQDPRCCYALRQIKLCFPSMGHWIFWSKWSFSLLNVGTSSVGTFAELFIVVHHNELSFSLPQHSRLPSWRWYCISGPTRPCKNMCWKVRKLITESLAKPN